MKYNFTGNIELETGYSENSINVSIIDLHSNNNLSLKEYNHFLSEIQECNPLHQEDVEGLDIKNISDEKKYEADVEIMLEYSSSYDYYSGETEYDVNVFITVKSYKEVDEKEAHPNNSNYINLDSHTIPFHCYYSQYAGETYIRNINKDKISIAADFEGIHRKMFISPYNLARILVEYKPLIQTEKE